MTHDPLCDWWQDQCASECNINLAYGDPCEHMWCTCVLIAMVRADERQQEEARRMAKFGYWHDYSTELP